MRARRHGRRRAALQGQQRAGLARGQLVAATRQRRRVRHRRHAPGGQSFDPIIQSFRRRDGGDFVSE